MIKYTQTKLERKLTENKMDFQKHVPTIEKKINYVFRDKSLLKQAFTRSSYCNEKNYKGRENYSSNEVLEFFGDSVLSTAIISLLLEEKTRRYPHGIQTELNEGDLSNIRSKLSDKRNLSRCTSQLGLQKYLLLGEGDSKLMISEEASVMEDLFESIIGAVYIDSSMDIKTVIRVVSGMLDISEYSNGEAPIQSYKNALQEWCADKSRRLPPPVYKTISEEGPDHKKVYERGCYIGEKLYGVGKGKNQKLADTAAAEAALAKLKGEETPKAENKDSARALRAYATERKIKSPEYHDLGEAPESTEEVKVFIIECCFEGITVFGTGASKNDARETASAKMLAEIAEKAKSTPKTKSDKADSAKGKQPKAKKPILKAQKVAAMSEAKAKEKGSAAVSESAAANTKDKPTLSLPQKKHPAQIKHKPAAAHRLQKGAKKSDKSPSPKKAPAHHTKRS